MSTHEASRTLFKSAPELWTECSEVDSLTRHLAGFGEIRITRLEPETAVAWEGEQISGTVRLESSGWGTKVILTARPGPAGPGEQGAPEMAGKPELQSEPAPLSEPEPVSESEPVSEPAPVRFEGPPTRRGLLRRLMAFTGLKRPTAVPAPPTWEDTDPELAPPLRAPAAAEPAAPEPGLAESAAAESPEPEAPDPDSPHLRALDAALDSLGQAHRRPFSHH